MAPAVKQDKTFKVKCSSGYNKDRELEIWGSDKGLHIRWFCGDILRWRPDRAHDQYQRFLMVTQHWQGVQVQDRADNHRYVAVRDDKTFACGDHQAGDTFSWAQFKKALDAAMKQIPANPQPAEGSG